MLMTELTAQSFNGSSVSVPQQQAEVQHTDSTPTSGDSVLGSSATQTPPMAKKKKKRPILKAVLIGIAVFLLFLIVAGSVMAYHTYTTAMTMKSQAESAMVIANSLKESFKAQDLPGMQTNLQELHTKVDALEQSFSSLSYFSFIPFLNAYYNDGKALFVAANAGLDAMDTTVAAIVPYADVLGFSGEGSFTGGTAEDRLKVLLQTLQAVEPQLDSIAADLEKANSAIASIDTNRYPETFRDIPVRSRILLAQETLNSANEILIQYRPIILRLPSIAGAIDGVRKKYLVLFQNDNELRPTGGFLTAYAIINVENGKVQAEKSDDIYELDKKFVKSEPIPEKLGKYLTTESRFNLRDMNISPDFKISMDQFSTNYRNIKGEAQNIDGIIAVDTEFLTNLLSILGPVDVPGYGKFSAEITPECDCPQIIYALSQIITRPVGYIKEDRKGILGPLMREILNKTYGSGKTQLPQIIEAGFAGLQGRHLQLYFFNEEDQKAAELINAAGRMTPPKENQDFLGIVNANLAGAKSNLFITYDVLQEVKKPENGTIEKTVAITYKNPRRADNCNLEAGLLCLNSTNNDWTRLFVPIGSTLISAQGFRDQPETYEENGMTVFDGFHTLQPNSTTKLIVTYTVPYTDTENYNLYQWKQGGITDIPMIIDVEGNQEEVLVNKDTVVSMPF